MNLHYFDDEAADSKDILLKIAIDQGYVPLTCLLTGPVVMMFVNKGKDPCKGCEGPRERCRGRDK